MHNREEEMETKMLHDIGVVCIFNHNYGNNLTNYALYCFLKDLGYSVMLIDVPKDSHMALPKDRDNQLELFMECPFEQEDFPEQLKCKDDLALMNQKCNAFLVGSDQLWRCMFVNGSNFFTCLDWVNSDKYKMSYATSFGVETFENNGGIKRKFNILLKRFQKISVRETFGCELLKNEFGIDAVQVLDPVLMCDKKYFDELADRGRKRIPQGNYVGAYILDPSEKKQKAIELISEHFFDDRKMIIYDAMNHIDGKCEKMSIEGIPHACVEEWIAMIRECDFFITDSFHGLCFALMYGRRFAVLFHNSGRGIERIQDILTHIGLEDHLLTDYSEESLFYLYKQEIDYNRVRNEICELRGKSQKWLLNALNESKHSCIQTLEMKDSYEIYLEQEYMGRHKLFLEKKQLLCEKMRLCPSDTIEHVIGWGTGGKFRRCIDKVLKYCEMKYVVDSRPDKWGKRFAENVICISPEELKEKKNVVVLIMVDSIISAFQIIETLVNMGISGFEYVDNYLRYIESLD